VSHSSDYLERISSYDEERLRPDGNDSPMLQRETLTVSAKDCPHFLKVPRRLSVLFFDLRTKPKPLIQLFEEGGLGVVLFPCCFSVGFLENCSATLFRGSVLR